METGEKIYVESILTDAEYSECAKKYPSTYPNGSKKPPFFNSEFKWRYRMGVNIPPDEINKILMIPFIIADGMSEMILHSSIIK